MKRLLATTAIALLASLGAAQAGDINIVIQDADFENEQNVINQLFAGAIEESSQAGTNISNVAALADSSPGAGGESDDGGTALDPLLVDALSYSLGIPDYEIGAFINSHGDIYGGAQLFADIQRVTNEAKARMGAAQVDQEGLNAANIFSVQDGHDGSDVGDVYLVYQSFGSWFADNTEETDNTRQIVENSITAADDVSGSQLGTNVANAVSILDEAGSLEDTELVGNQLLLVQVAGGPAGITKQYVGNVAYAGDDINGLTQEGTNAVNVATVTLTGDQASGLYVVAQKTYENFDQSIFNRATAHSIASGVSQAGTNVANAYSVSLTIRNGDNGS